MRSGFSLVELSIVLVILGLLTGGILTGQNLIRAAELRTIITGTQNYQTAIMTFRDKYFQLPGDMRNAEDFWGTMATGTCPAATAGTGTQTCNGDGDGKVEGGGAADQTVEHFTFWQHLANAGLIEGTYTGIAGPEGNNDADVGVNVPLGKLSNSGYSVRYFSADHASYYPIATLQNSITLGANAPSGQNNMTVGAIMNAEEVWGIDKKMDDGRPGLGRVITNNNANCATTTTASTAEYALSLSVASCHLVFLGAY